MAPTEFIKACNEGRIWVYCRTCQEPKNYQVVDHRRTIENPAYWGSEPWWHETYEFVCPDCGTTQKSTLHLQE